MKNKFLESISSRWGFNSLYYHPDHMCDDGYGDLQPGVNLPWYQGISRFVSNLYDKFYLLGKILSPSTGWCRWDNDYGIGINPKSDHQVRDLIRRYLFKRLFYTFKCVLCMFFCYRRPVPEYFFEYINVAIFNQQPSQGEYSGYNWDAVAVGYGVLENWYFWNYSDTSY